MANFHTSCEYRINQNCIAQNVAQSSILLTFNAQGSTLSSELHSNNVLVQACLHNIQQSPPNWLLDIVASYNTLLIEYDMLSADSTQVIHWLKHLSTKTRSNQPTKQHYIDVCYEFSDEHFPNDIDAVAAQKNISLQDVINAHTAQAFTIFAVGFMPNFAYLGELPPSLVVPRLKNPRLKVPAGAVAIADKQTAVYPSVSPGGWHIIGYTKA